ncbi:MAG: hypothetical protein KDI75_04230 [Xanthomonadales bacterium]|nr:hypothetical protein [Xanthomonadales bacterium]
MASSFTVNPSAATAPLGGGATTPTAITVDWDPEAGTGDSFEVEVAFDDTAFDVSVSGNCNYVAASGIVTVIAFDAFSNTLPAGSYCTMNFTATAAALEQVYPLTLQNDLVTDGGADQGASTLNDGQITVQAAPPTTQTVTASAGAGGTVAPPTQDVTSGNTANVTVTPNAGYEVTAIGGTCGGTPAPALPSSAPVTFTTNPVGTAGDPDHSADCTVTATFGAIPAPIYASTPAPGSSLNCTSGGTTTVNIQNIGDLPLNVSCSIGAPFSSAGPASPIAPAGNSDVTVTCPTIADGDPPVNGTLACSSDGGPDARYPVTASAIPPIPPAIPSPQLVPSSSLWSKLMLFGFLAGLGALVISLRRS